MPRETTMIECVYQTQTAKAVCVEVDGETFWIPKSVIEDGEPDESTERGAEIEIEVHLWFAEKSGLT